MAVCQYSVRGPELDLNELGQVAETVTARVPYGLMCCHQRSLRGCIV